MPEPCIYRMHHKECAKDVLSAKFLENTQCQHNLSTLFYVSVAVQAFVLKLTVSFSFRPKKTRRQHCRWHAIAKKWYDTGLNYLKILFWLLIVSTYQRDRPFSILTKNKEARLCILCVGFFFNFVQTSNHSLPSTHIVFWIIS